jgi:hypothetical protein
MPKIEIANFAGETPRVSPVLLPENFSQLAETCDLVSGEINTWSGLSKSELLAKSGEIRRLHLFGGTTWLHWTEDVDVAKVALAGDVTERTVFTGVGAPRVTDSSLVDIGGNGEFPESSYILGIPAPETAPVPTVDGTPAGNPEDRVYVYTHVREWPSGAVDEGPPSPATITVTVESGEYAELHGLEAPPAGTGITHKRIYRSVTAGGETALQFVAQIDQSETTYLDDVDTADLGETLTTLLYDPPPSDLTALIALENGVLAGISKNQVCFCEPYQFHAWPVTYRITMDHDGVGLGSIGGTVVVGTEGNPYLITGVDPAVMSPLKLPGLYPCVSKRGMVSSDVGVFFPSIDGLIAVGTSQGAKVVTKGLLSEEDWANMAPETMHAYYHSNRYFGFYKHDTDESGFIIDYDRGDLTRLPYYASAGYVGGERAKLFLVFDEVYGNVVREWDHGGVPLMYTWKSKSYLTPPTSFSVAEVLSEKKAEHTSDFLDEVIDYNQSLIDSGQIWCGDLAGTDIAGTEIAGDCFQQVPEVGQLDTLWFSIYGDGELLYSKAIESNEPFRLPGGKLLEEWIVQVSGNRSVKKITIATNMRELGRG